MLTNDTVSALHALAGDDFTWTASKGGHRPTSKARGPLRDWLADRQGGICPACGDVLRHGEFNHVVGQGPVRRGYLTANIFVGCATCNTACEREFGYTDDDGKRYGGVIPVERFARPDLIGTEPLPSITSLLRNLGIIK